MNLISCVDIALLSVILVCGFEVVRLLHPRRQPWLTLAFVLLTVGAFGWISYDIRGQSVPWFAVVLHAGFAAASIMVLMAQRASEAATELPRDLARRRSLRMVERRR
jgi:hypothetical protein